MELPKRKNPRLRDYDYSRNNAYFVTICTDNRERLFGEIRRGDPCGRPQMEYTALGKIADRTFLYIEQKYDIILLQYVVMPDHVHAIIIIDQNTGVTDSGDRKGRPYSDYSLSRIIGAYKSIVSSEWLRICKEKNIAMGKIWQRSYYDHIIRNPRDMQETIKYIYESPIKWYAENVNP